MKPTSSLLALAGTVTCDLSAIEPAPVPKMREVPQDPELAKRATTPLPSSLWRGRLNVMSPTSANAMTNTS